MTWQVFGVSIRGAPETSDSVDLCGAVFSSRTPFWGWALRPKAKTHHFGGSTKKDTPIIGVSESPPLKRKAKQLVP